MHSRRPSAYLLMYRRVEPELNINLSGPVRPKMPRPRLRTAHS